MEMIANKMHQNFKPNDKIFVVKDKSGLPAKVIKMAAGNWYDVLFYGSNKSETCRAKDMHLLSVDTEHLYATKDFRVAFKLMKEDAEDVGVVRRTTRSLALKQKDQNGKKAINQENDENKPPAVKTVEPVRKDPMQQKRRPLTALSDKSNTPQKAVNHLKDPNEAKKLIVKAKTPEIPEQVGINQELDIALEDTCTMLRQQLPKAEQLSLEEINHWKKQLKDLSSRMVLTLKLPDVVMEKKANRIQSKGKFSKASQKRIESYKTLNDKSCLEKRTSPIEGSGAFATRDIKFNELLIEYVGDRINKYEADAREERYKRKGKGHCYLFAIRSTDIIIDATETGNDSKFINHSCNPNTQVKPVEIDGKIRILFFAKRAIKKDDELTLDYMFEEEKIKCKCGAVKCRQYLN